MLRWAIGMRACEALAGPLHEAGGGSGGSDSGSVIVRGALPKDMLEKAVSDVLGVN